MNMLQLFQCFNIECNPQKGIRGLSLPIDKPLWNYKPKGNKKRYTESPPVIDTVPHLPGYPGSEERIEYLAEYYQTAVDEISPFPVF